MGCLVLAIFTHTRRFGASAWAGTLAAWDDRDAGVRGGAVVALLKMGPAAREALPALTKAEQNRDAAVQAAAARALEKLRGTR
jgi:HEAT repeat protein